ncbi:MAG: Fic family protein [Propionibacteriaceae bacterium]|jgi:Fic family protein|nr:Fic family protein [Propionibacteriaceae bacterium]
MDAIFEPPRLSTHDEAVLGEIEAIRRQLSTVLRAPRRWQGTLRRSAQAKAIRGSNSIEGYRVSEEDAAAAVDDEPALNADQQTWAEILGYRRVLTYVLQVATNPEFALNEGVIQSMHFMLLDHDLSKSPGLYRNGPIYVADEQGTVYTAPEAERVPTLVRALVDQVNDQNEPSLIAAAMAHLNLVMIHPFRDGNGRMGRALQTLVLAMDHILEPAFSSIEEWLGANTADYYSVLAATGAGSWNPERDTELWVRFNLRAHHMQAQTVRRRFEEAGQQWILLDTLVETNHLPERTAELLFEALLGFRVTRPFYIARSGLDERQATRDLARLTDLGLLTSHGQTKGRYYTAGPTLAESHAKLREERLPLADPYPDLMAEVKAEEARVTRQRNNS